MATSTDVPIYTTTLSSAVPSVTIDLSAYQNYKNIKIVATPTVATSNANTVYRFNGDTGANYSYTQTYADGSSTVTNGPTNQTSINSGFTTTAQPVKIIYLMDYANSNTDKKTTLTRQSNASEVVQAIVGLWRSSSNAAITSVTFSLSDGGNFAIGSTFSVYGIGSATTGAKATGGAIYSDADYMYHVFTSTGAFVPSQSLTADVLVVAGGGAGGHKRGGGGGAGGLSYHASRSLSATNYTVTVGAGGTSNTGDNTTAGGDGGNSTFDTITSYGGGGGASAQANGGDGSANNGGSGGGRNATGSAGTSYGTSTQSNTGGAIGYGNRGGDNGANSGNTAGGGGGAGSVGGNGSGGDTVGGTGGAGLNTWSSWLAITGAGSSGYLAGGGGGGTSTGSSYTGGTGGSGGGGAGASSDGAARAGIVHSGGGGGGGAGTNNYPGNSGGNGGSGVVIVRYAK